MLWPVCSPRVQRGRSRDLRYVLIDRIVALEPPTRARGLKCVSLSDDVFGEHFPGLPVLPGALILEAFGQLGGVLVEATLRSLGKPDLYALLSMVDRAKFRRPVQPGDCIELEVTSESISEHGGQLHGRASVGGRLVAEANLGFATAAVHNARFIAQRKELLETWTRQIDADL